MPCHQKKKDLNNYSDALSKNIPSPEYVATVDARIEFAAKRRILERSAKVNMSDVKLPGSLRVRGNGPKRLDSAV